jgi:hypothetical protein
MVRPFELLITFDARQNVKRTRRNVLDIKHIPPCVLLQRDLLFRECTQIEIPYRIRL